VLQTQIVCPKLKIANQVNPEMVEPFCTTPGLVEPRYNAKAMLEKKDLKTVERMEVRDPSRGR